MYNAYLIEMAPVVVVSVKRGNIVIVLYAPAERMPELTRIFRQANTVGMSTRRLIGSAYTIKGRDDARAG